VSNNQTYKQSVCAEGSVLMLKQVVHVLTNML